MDKFIIEGGVRLNGEINAQGSKNAVLPLLAASILTKEEVTLRNVPDLVDVRNMIKILQEIGVYVCRHGSTVTVRADGLNSDTIPADLAKELRSSVFLLGSVLARLRRAKVPYPGGCDIGLRPIDIHIKGLRDLNVSVKEESGYIVCGAENMQSAEICLDYPSVGATENIMLAALCCKGETVIGNAAREPEIVDLQNFLRKTGADVRGAGTSKITVFGGKKLHGTDYTVMPDRIFVGTVLLTTATVGGETVINGTNPEDLRALLCKIDKNSCKVTVESDRITIQAKGGHKTTERVITQPYPGFPTDLQAPFMTYLAVAQGTAVLTETIFENRFRHVPELKKMGANILIRDRVAVVKGVPFLIGAEVTAMDLRGGAALVTAGLCARGITVLSGVQHIDRGYEKMEYVLEKLGAKIARI